METIKRISFKLENFKRFLEDITDANNRYYLDFSGNYVKVLKEEREGIFKHTYIKLDGKVYD